MWCLSAESTSKELCDEAQLLFKAPPTNERFLRELQDFTERLIGTWDPAPRGKACQLCACQNCGCSVSTEKVSRFARGLISRICFRWGRCTNQCCIVLGENGSSNFYKCFLHFLFGHKVSSRGQCSLGIVSKDGIADCFVASTRDTNFRCSMQ